MLGQAEGWPGWAWACMAVRVPAFAVRMARPAGIVITGLTRAVLAAAVSPLGGARRLPPGPLLNDPSRCAS